VQSMPIWQAILLGVLALALVFLWRPGLKEALRRSREAKERDWSAALIPIALVALFVAVLIALAR